MTYSSGQDDKEPTAREVNTVELLMLCFEGIKKRKTGENIVLSPPNDTSCMKGS